MDFGETDTPSDTGFEAVPLKRQNRMDVFTSFFQDFVLGDITFVTSCLLTQKTESFLTRIAFIRKKLFYGDKIHSFKTGRLWRL